MRSPTTLLGAAAVLSGSVVTWGWDFASSGEFNEAIATNDYTLVAFVDPSLDSSNTLEPQWDMVREAEHEHVIAINCVKQGTLCEELQVASYPAIRLFYDDGSYERYRGPRKAHEILPFLRRCLRPVVTELDSKNITSFLTIDDVVFVGHLPDEDDNLLVRYDALAEDYRDRYSFGWVPTSKAPSGIGCYNNIDNEQHVVSAELDDAGAMQRFLQLCTKPLIPELTRRNELEYLQAGKSLVYYFLTTDSQREEYRTAMRPLARRYREFLTFVVVDANEYAEMLAVVGLEEHDTPALAVQNPANGQVFPYEGGEEITVQVVESFVLNIVDGIVKPWDGPKNSPAGETTAAAHDEL